MQLFGYHGYTQSNYILFHIWPSFHTKRMYCKFGQDRMSSFSDMTYVMYDSIDTIIVDIVRQKLSTLTDFGQSST